MTLEEYLKPLVDDCLNQMTEHVMNDPVMFGMCKGDEATMKAAVYVVVQEVCKERMQVYVDAHQGGEK